MTEAVTLRCLDCKKEFQTEHVSLMGQKFFAERYCHTCLVRERGTDALHLQEGRTRLKTTAMIKEVTKRNIEPKSGKAPFTLFEIEDSDGTKWTTSKQGLALEAHSLVGKIALIDGTMRENGQYMNYYLEGISEAPNSDMSHTNGNILDTTTSANAAESVRDTSGSRDEQIWRQTATKVAAQLADTPIDFWLNVDLLLDFYRTGVHPEQQEGEYATAAAFTQDDGLSDIPF